MAAIAPILVILGAIYLYATGKFGDIVALFRKKPDVTIPKSDDSAALPLVPKEPVLTLTLDQYEVRLKKREDELRKELSETHSDERTLLQAQIDELTRQQNNPEDAFKAFKTRIAELEALLGNAETEDEQEAKAALEAGDLVSADDIFARISAAQALNIKKAANAEFARGEIAEQQIRWKDAAVHFADAARLDPTFHSLLKAQDFAGRSGAYEDALGLGKRLVEAAQAEFGDKSLEYSSALNQHALTLEATGRYDDAEPLYREALKIDEATIGKDHPDYAIHLNNLAELLRATGRYDDAEPLYREALKIGEATIGKDHPDYAIHLNNLAELLRDTGRYDDAEPLYREALKIGEATIGKDHPAYATRLNNLALLLRDTGRYDDAEPLYREALKIDEATLGKDHPDYARGLNNLAGLLRATGRSDDAEPLYREAIGILVKSLGEDHPNTKTGRKNLEILLEQMGKA